MNRYNNLSRFFHWLIAGMIVTQFLLAELAESAKHNDKLLEQLALLANHKSIGITVLVLAIFRLLYRFSSKPPALPNVMPRWQKLASHFSHFTLYGLLFAMPISGWLMSSAKAYSVSWFNLFSLPDFVAPDESLANLLHSVHHYLAEALFVIAVLHIAAALKHHFIDKDDVLRRMAGVKSWVLFITVVVFTIAAFGRFFGGSNMVEPDSISNTAEAQLIIASDLPLWEIDYGHSYIKFSGDQAGAPFAGEWKVWSADIQFDANTLTQSRFNVIIDTSSGFSNDSERDDTIRSADFFNADVFKEAQYTAQKFEQTGEQFRSLGQLSMKGVTIEVPLNFTVVEVDKKRVLKGTASLDRLLWNIGAGDWADTSWVGQYVLVEVLVTTLEKSKEQND